MIKYSGWVEKDGKMNGGTVRYVCMHAPPHHTSRTTSSFEISVKNGRQKWPSKIAVKNGRQKWQSKMVVKNGRQK